MKERERLVLQYIIKFKEVNGSSPTVKEIAKGLNTKSILYVKTAIEELAEKGYIKYIHNKPRTIVVLKFL